MRKLLPMLFWAALVITLGCTSVGEQLEGEGLLVLEAVTLIDGTGAAPRSDAIVVIQDAQIIRVGRIGDYRYPDNTRVLNLAGRCLLPGFIEMHAHVATGPIVSDTVDGRKVFRAIYNRGASEDILRTLLAMGITTVRNPGGPTVEAIALRNSVADSRLLGPTILTAGNIIVAAPSYWVGLSTEVQSENEVREEVRRQAAAGVDYVKLYFTLMPELVRAGIDEAHAQGIKAIGHLGVTSWTEAAEAGIDGLVHGVPAAASLLPPDRREEYLKTQGTQSIYRWLELLNIQSSEIEKMVSVLVENSVPVDPTLVVFEALFWGDDPAYLEHPELSLVPKNILESWRRSSHTEDWSDQDFRRAKAVWPKFLKFIKELHDRGVLLLAGSDLPNPWVIPGVSFHRELELMVGSGISPLEVLKIATHNGAEALGILDKTGTVEVGKRADLVILTANPIDDIRNTRKIESVIKDGKLINPESLRK